MFFSCKQNTSYEMRISDWSSDVCSSDLSSRDQAGNANGRRFRRSDFDTQPPHLPLGDPIMGKLQDQITDLVERSYTRGMDGQKIAKRLIESGIRMMAAEGDLTDEHRIRVDRKSVVEGKSRYGRLNLGGRGFLKKKKKKKS